MKNWKTGLTGGIVMLLASVLTYPQPMIARFLIDDVLMQKKLDLVLPVVLLLALIGAASFVFGMLRQFYTARFSQEVILDLQEKLMQKVLSLPKLFFDKNRSGYLMSRVLNDVQGVNWFISGTVTQLITEIIKFIGGLCFLFYLDWRIAAVITATLPLPFLTTRFFARRNYVLSHYCSELYVKTSAVFTEAFSSVPLIKAFAAEQRTLGKLTEQLRKRIAMNYEQVSISSLSQAVNRLTPVIARLLVLIAGSFLVIDGQWQIGTLVAFLAYLNYVYSPVTNLSSNVCQLETARATLDRIASLFEMLSEDNTDEGLPAVKFKGEIEFKNVSFAYDAANPVLSDISFKIDPGEHWVVTGSSGIGKTTLISLILRFYKPQKGEIFFDDAASSEFNVRSLRQRFGYVSQSTCLQSGSVMENLKYGNPEASENDVVKAAKTADIHDFIKSLPEKYDTVIEENAVNFSEGQKQRLSIARALVKNPDILILDEPASALDSATEKSIYEALPESVRNKTTITITHHLNTVSSSDKIIFLRKNKPPLIGSREDLSRHREFKDFFSEEISSKSAE
jgi:ABC-type bacteriocin/lantibiotic exporter with double-glycine peptidase domain